MRTTSRFVRAAAATTDVVAPARRRSSSARPETGCRPRRGARWSCGRPQASVQTRQADRPGDDAGHHGRRHRRRPADPARPPVVGRRRGNGHSSIQRSVLDPTEHAGHRDQRPPGVESLGAGHGGRVRQQHLGDRGHRCRFEATCTPAGSAPLHPVRPASLGTRRWRRQCPPAVRRLDGRCLGHAAVQERTELVAQPARPAATEVTSPVAGCHSPPSTAGTGAPSRTCDVLLLGVVA